MIIIQVPLRRTTLVTLVQMHRTAGAHGPFSTFVNDLLESDAADFRLVKVQRDVRPQGVPPKIRTTKGTGRLRKIGDPEVVEQICSLRGELTVRQLSQRFSICQSTVRRILQGHERKDE